MMGSMFGAYKVNKYLREYIDKVDKVEIQAKNAGSQLIADNLYFSLGSQGSQGSQHIRDKRNER